MAKLIAGRALFAVVFAVLVFAVVNWLVGVHWGIAVACAVVAFVVAFVQGPGPPGGPDLFDRFSSSGSSSTYD